LGRHYAAPVVDKVTATLSQSMEKIKDAPAKNLTGASLASIRGGGGYACWMALSLQALGPTGRVKVQYSSNLTGSLRLPSTTWPELSSTV
jgi:hypothetical protein